MLCEYLWKQNNQKKEKKKKKNDKTKKDKRRINIIDDAFLWRCQSAPCMKIKCQPSLINVQCFIYNLFLVPAFWEEKRCFRYKKNMKKKEDKVECGIRCDSCNQYTYARVASLRNYRSIYTRLSNV